MKHHYLLVRWRNWRFCKLGFVCRAKPNGPNADWLKIAFKKSAVEKNERRRVGQCVWSDAVLLEYRFYVLVHLPKWFTSSQFLVVCLLVHCHLLGLPLTVSGMKRRAFRSCELVHRDKACQEPKTCGNHCPPYVLYPLLPHRFF